MASIKNLTRQNHVFIDPENCGSGVGYYITVDEYHNRKENTTEYSLSAEVILSDCNHKIDWHFGSEDDDDKIDAAIKILSEFRKKFLETLIRVEKLKNTGAK